MLGMKRHEKEIKRKMKVIRNKGTGEGIIPSSSGIRPIRGRPTVAQDRISALAASTAISVKYRSVRLFVCPTAAYSIHKRR